MSLVALLMVAVLVVPGALAMNRRTWLRNLTLWLTVLVGLVSLYQRFGPF